ncbi:MAG: copper chaperone PCu(A)C [Ahrensia sp.]
MRKLILAAAATLLTATTALAHEYKIGDLVIDHPVARATPANAPVSAGYMTIRNTGDEADTLISGSVGFATKTELHEMTMDNDVMKMRELDGGIEIPAGGEVTLVPGGLHVMFKGMNEQLVEGEEHTAELVFEKAGPVEVTFIVESLEKIRESMKGDMMKMDHSNHSDHSGHSAN